MTKKVMIVAQSGGKFLCARRDETHDTTEFYWDEDITNLNLLMARTDKEMAGICAIAEEGGLNTQAAQFNALVITYELIKDPFIHGI